MATLGLCQPKWQQSIIPSVSSTLRGLQAELQSESWCWDVRAACVSASLFRHIFFVYCMNMSLCFRPLVPSLGGRNPPEGSQDEQEREQTFSATHNLVIYLFFLERCTILVFLLYIYWIHIQACPILQMQIIQEWLDYLLALLRVVDLSHCDSNSSHCSDDFKDLWPETWRFVYFSIMLCCVWDETNNIDKLLWRYFLLFD